MGHMSYSIFEPPSAQPRDPADSKFFRAKNKNFFQYCRQLFNLLENSSNQMKKMTKITLTIFKKVTSLQIKKSMKKPHF
jgi:hypothetical protein